MQAKVSPNGRPLNNAFIAGLWAVYVLVIITLIGLDTSGKLHNQRVIGASKYDQDTYHLRQVNEFLAVPFTGQPYHSYTATTPGQHLVSTFLAKASGASTVDDRNRVVRFGQILWVIGAVCAVLLYFRKKQLEDAEDLRGGWSLSIWLLPFFLTPYTLNTFVFVTTDGGALMWILFAMLCVLDISQLQSRVVLWTIASTMAVLWRQTSLWLALPWVFLKVKVSSGAQRLVAIASAAIPVLVLGYFVHLWGGTTPKEFVTVHAKGWTGAGTMLAISLFGMFSVLFSAAKFPRSLVAGLPAAARPSLATRIGLGLGLLMAILMPSSYSMPDGRTGGMFWDLVKHLPKVADRSLLFVLTVPLGAVALAWWWDEAIDDSDRALVVAFLGFAVVGGAVATAFERYYVPCTLLILGLLASRRLRDDRVKLAWPMGISFAMLLLDVVQFR